MEIGFERGVFGGGIFVIRELIFKAAISVVQTLFRIFVLIIGIINRLFSYRNFGAVFLWGKVRYKKPPSFKGGNFNYDR